MSTGHYHRRWSSSTAGRITPTSFSTLSSAIEPSTYGTSWNSVRWNKPSSGYRSQSSSIAARYDKPTTYTSPSPARTSTSRFQNYNTSDAAKSAAELASLGPPVSSRASRFDSTVRDTKEKYRNEARELINKWTSRERPTGYFSQHFEPHKLYAENSYSRKPFENSTYLSKTNDFPYRKSSSMTPMRSAVPAVARYSSLDRSSVGLLSPSPTPQLTTTPKFERPWRQRMAESSRIRAIHGDEVSASYSAARARASGSRASSRRGSLSQASGDEISSCLDQLRSYLNHSGYTSRDSSVYGPSSRFSTSYTSGYNRKKDEEPSKYMSRSYSPVRSPRDLFKNSSTSAIQSMDKPSIERASRPSSRESLRDDSRERSHVSVAPKNSTIRESSKERELDRKRTRSSKERTARRNSRQRSQQLDSSSSGDDMESREDARRRRRKKKTDSDVSTLPPSSSSTAIANLAAMVSSVYDTSKEDLGCHPVPAASAQPESPSVVEVPGISRSNSKPEVGPLSPLSPSLITSLAESISLALSNSLDNIDDILLDSEDPSVASSVQGDESQYSAVAHFKPYKPKVKRIAPVPGLWNSTGDEQVISKNKSLIKEEEHLTTFKIWKVKPHEKAIKRVKVPIKKKKDENKEEKSEQKITQDSPIKKLFMGKKKATKTDDETGTKEKPKPVAPKEESVAVSASFTAKPSAKSQVASITLKDKRRVDLPPKKLKAIRKDVEIKIDKVFQKKAAVLGTQKTIKSKAKHRTSHNFKCKESRNVSIQLTKELKAKEAQRGAQVIVDRPQRNVNAARVKLRCRQPQKKISTPIQVELERNGEQPSMESEKIRLKASQEESRRSMSRDSQSRAAELLDEMRYTEPALEWRRRDSGGQLVLPDKSILEEYVRRKRGHLERLHSEPIRDDLSVTTCDSPCPSTTSELIPACAVRVHGASPLVPIITAPSRCSTIETSTPMLESIQTLAFNNFNSTPQGFLRNNAAKLQCSRPITFDAPKTPFEERLQQQANAIRRASHSSQVSDLEMREPSPRRGSEAPSISSAFTAAVAEKAVQPRHERYAAHIPVNRGETSGRQSSASVDSTQSGALDQATKQLDQVIDQARHRHHQHRSKFKEAIDYLDQIFEDLKKECDVTGEDKNNNSEGNTATVHFTPREQKRTVVYPTAAQQLKTNSLPDRSQRHNKFVAPSAPSPVEVTLSKQKVSEPAPSEVAVTETIVLPKKTDKLDFTRRWLQDDLSSLAQQPSGPVMFSDTCMYQDADEHSLGSCSAEVAAINANRKEKNKKNHTAPAPAKVSQPAPIRPQPQRLQPSYAVPGSSNGTRHFPVEFDGLQRVASFDHVHAPRENSWRAGSQEPYQTLGSVRSDVDRPSPSAFQNVSAFSQRGGMRGSLRSLQNVDITPSFKMPLPKDPTLAIDALVAELELNTEQPTSIADKRRSFPTSLRAEQHEHVRRGSERQGSRGRNGYGKQASYQEQQSFPSQSQQIRHNRQQRSLDEAASMLQHVVGDLGAIQRQKKPLNQQNSLNHSLLQNPFETINQEKISPSRVEAMHNMFERGAATWRSPQPYQQPVPQPYKAPKDDECYYDLADYAIKAYKRVSPPRQVQTVRHSPLTSSQEFTPAYPLTNPPQHPPGRNGSANSSTNGGYYSSNSSTAGPSHPPTTHRSSLIGRQSLISSRGPSVDDEDDGFYDNIGFEDRRFSRCSEMDAASISSRPPTGGNQKHNRIGSFLRKIGGSSRPSGSAASLISLNKVAQESPIRSGGLMKSNSLSTEPWKKEVLQQSMPNQTNKGGLGQRLKNSLFGSKKRLNG